MSLRLLREYKDSMPPVGLSSEYQRWLVHAVYAILCYLIERDEGSAK